MTLESVVGQECGFLESRESVDLYEIGEVPYLYSPVESWSQGRPLVYYYSSSKRVRPCWATIFSPRCTDWLIVG